MVGRQLFEKDSGLITNEAQYEEEGAVSVDIRQYERPEELGGDVDDEEEVKLGDMSDDD